MAVGFNPSVPHRIVTADSHYYENPTAPLYLNRTLQYHDLIYLIDGGWTFTEDEHDYCLKKDDVLLLSAEHHHYTRYPCLPNTRTFCIHVASEPGDLARQADTVVLPSLMHMLSSRYARHYFSEIVSTFWSSRPYKQERLSTMFNLLLFELADIDRQSRKQPNIAEEIICLISMNPHKHFTVQEIANQFLVNTKSVEAAMQHYTGLSFSKYQMARKLEMIAKQIDVEPETRLAELAETFGFCDEFHLSKAFKQKYGMSPTQYKQELTMGNS